MKIVEAPQGINEYDEESVLMVKLESGMTIDECKGALMMNMQINGKNMRDDVFIYLNCRKLIGLCI
jgi:hypothetical protein